MFTIQVLANQPPERMSVYDVIIDVKYIFETHSSKLDGRGFNNTALLV